MASCNRFVDSNDRELQRIQPLIDEANALEPEFEALSDAEIRARFDALRDEIRAIAEPDEPSEDELNHPERERRRDLAKARRKRRERADRRRPRRGRAGGLRDDPRGDPSGRWRCATSTSS